MDLGLNNKRALVMGGGAGLGRAVALSLASEGAHVVVAGRTQEKLDDAVAEIMAAGGKASALVWDLSQLDQIQSKAAQAASQLKGSIQILFNNGGGPAPGTAHGQAADAWQAQFQNMVLSLICLTDAVLPGMLEQGWGRVITNGSSGVILPIPNLAMSNTLRSALVGWSKTLANEVAAKGITVNMVLPGRVYTDRIAFLDNARAGREGISLEEVEKKSKASIPMGRYGKPEEYGDFVAFLASERASYITGSMHRVDGGAILNI
jgi:3-oxoacyl-[acyl-carrier protein] reductase